MIKEKTNAYESPSVNVIICESAMPLATSGEHEGFTNDDENDEESYI